MRLRRRIATTLALSLIAGLVATSPAPAAQANYDVTDEIYIVKTRHGNLYVEVSRPVSAGKDVRAPAVLTYSPYSVLGRSNVASNWVSAGYASVFADVVGTGNSGGCYDYGGKREKETGYDLVEWIAKQPWSSGKVAMTGGSYNGTTANATAVMNPPHLTTIVPIAAISRWYEYAYSGGIRYALNNESPTDEGIDTPLGFDFGFAIPPPVNPTDPEWQDRVLSSTTPCDEVVHTEHGYDDTPDYDDFWLERDYIKDAAKIRIPVLIGANWGDWNVKQEESINLFRALKNSPNKKLFMGSRYSGHGAPGGDWDLAVRAWFDHYLMGMDNGAENMATVTSNMSSYDGTGEWYKGAWPKTRPVTLIAQSTPKTEIDDYIWGLLPTAPVAGMGPAEVAQFPSTNVNTESHANHHARNNHDWFWFESPALVKDTRIFGEVKVKLYSTIDREWVTFTPTIVDVDPSCHLTAGGQHVADPSCTANGLGLSSVTRGWLDTRYSKSLSKQTLLEPGKEFGVTIVTKPQDYTFKKGHLIGLNIQTEINEWSLPKPYPCASDGDTGCVYLRINWEKGKTRVILPVVNGPRNAASLFTHAHHH